MRRLLALPLALLLALPCPSSTAYAQGKPSAPAKEGDAGEHFLAGVEFYKNRDYAAALVEFKRAYELDPHHRVLFNLGQTSQELNDYASALSAFERYLREGDKAVDKERRKKVEAWIDALKKKVGRVTIELEVEGAEVLVDDLPVGKAPLSEPVIVNAGRHKVAASAKGYLPVSRVIEVTAQEEPVVKLELVKLVEEREPPPPPPPPPPPEPKTNVPAWVALSATGAAAVIAGITGGLAVSARGDLDEALSTFPGNAANIGSAQDKVQTLALVTDVMIGVAAAGAATTVVLFIVDPLNKASADEPAAPAATTKLELSPSGLWLRGKF